MNKILLVLLLLCCSATCLHAQEDSLMAKIIQISEKAQGKVSVGILNIENRDSLYYYGDEHCVLQSVFKFPIALMILDKIDKGEFSLQHKIHVTKEDMVPNTWSPMRNKYPNGNVNLTFEELLKYMVSESDNIACDILLKHLGGPKKLTKYIQKSGIEDFSVKANEAKMRKGWKIQYSNYGSPKALVQLYDKLYQGKMLSDTNTMLLKKWLEETSTGPKRLKALLPDGTIIAHKTGTSGTNEQDMTAAVNDTGVITLPNGQHLIVTVFVNDAKADFNTLETVIAEISKAAYERFSQ